MRNVYNGRFPCNINTKVVLLRPLNDTQRYKKKHKSDNKLLKNFNAIASDTRTL